MKLKLQEVIERLKTGDWVLEISTSIWATSYLRQIRGGDGYEDFDGRTLNALLDRRIIKCIKDGFPYRIYVLKEESNVSPKT